MSEGLSKMVPYAIICLFIAIGMIIYKIVEFIKKRKGELKNG